MERRSPTRRLVRPEERTGRSRLAACIFAATLALFAAVPLISPYLQASTAALEYSAPEDGTSLLISANDAMPFIRYSTKGWVLGDASPNEALGICEVLDRRYRCPLKDKQDHGGSIARLEEELRIRPR